MKTSQISDENILAVYPDIEQFLEVDIITESFLDKITNQYLDLAKLPKFEHIRFDITEYCGEIGSLYIPMNEVHRQFW